MNKKVICIAAAAYAAIVIFAAILLSANPSLDVVANYALKSFETLGEAVEISAYSGNTYAVYSPSRAEQFQYGEIVQLTFDAAPFLAAGFDPASVKSAITVSDAYIIIPSENALGFMDTGSAVSTMEAVLRNNRQTLEFHMDHDLFELHLGGGHAFRWAKDWRTNTRGMTFVINPEPFVQAGLDPTAIEGWSLASITLDHGRGETVERLLKVYSYN